MPDNGRGNRRLPNWIESFIQFSENIRSPLIYRKWAAISILGSVLERRVWFHSSRSDLFPNLYLILVGPPGVGKSQILSQTENILRSLKDFHVAPSSMTTASMIDTIHDASRTVVYPVLKVFNSLQVVSSELGVFLPAYDPAFMHTLTKLYDGELYEERRRTGKVNHVRIEHPLLSILGGTTPNYLGSFLPDGAWDQGFTSRTILVYSDEVADPDPFAIDTPNDDIYRDLVYDLSIIKEIYGQSIWEKPAQDAFNHWRRGGFKPVPSHAKLTHYNTRRITHMLKLAMIAEIAKRNSANVTYESLAEAMTWLFEAEALIPQIFANMIASGDSRVMQDCCYMVEQRFKATKTPVGEHHIVGFLKDRVPAYNIRKIIEVMLQSHKIKQATTGGYLPGD